MNKNLLLAPQFPDGEIVNAFLVRVLAYSGSPSLLLACRRLLSRRPGLDGMPSSLGKFHNELGYLYGDIDTLIHQHTEYNFFCCGLPHERFEAQRARLIEMHRGPVRLCHLPLLFTRCESNYLCCPECAELQKKAFGFSFIHRRTGAPFVNMCHMHGLALRPEKHPLLLFERQCQSPANRHQKNMTMELGKRIEHCMETPTMESKYHKDDLLQLLRDSGWIGRDGRLHAVEFIKEFIKFFAGAFADDRLVILCQSERYVENAIRSLLRHDKALYPEWCVLFRWFAEEQAHASNIQCGVSRADVRSPQAMAHSKPVWLREAVEQELVKHRTLGATAKAMGVSVPLLSALCHRYEIALKWRPKTLTEDCSRQIRDALRAIGLYTSHSTSSRSAFIVSAATRTS